MPPKPSYFRLKVFYIFSCGFSLKLGGENGNGCHRNQQHRSACVGAALVHVALKQLYRLSVFHFQYTGCSFYSTGVISHILSVRLLYRVRQKELPDLGGA